MYRFSSRRYSVCCNDSFPDASYPLVTTLRASAGSSSSGARSVESAAMRAKEDNGPAMEMVEYPLGKVRLGGVFKSVPPAS